MKILKLKFLLLAIFCIFLAEPALSQSSGSESFFHPYHVNYWVSGGIIAVGATGNALGVTMSSNKPLINSAEITALNPYDINSFDKWALKQDPANRSHYATISDDMLMGILVLPGFMLFNDNIRHDWLDVLLMYAETMSITVNIYEYSFLGPAFQGRFRPAVYYPSVDHRTDGFNRSSFYSGHTATTAAATFFMAKVYTDYHPEFGGYKYLIYAAAAVPPLIDGYFRVKALFHFPSDVMVGLGVGALCGIVIPEFHHFQVKDVKLGMYTSPMGTGITMNWQPNLLK